MLVYTQGVYSYFDFNSAKTFGTKSMPKSTIIVLYINLAFAKYIFIEEILLCFNNTVLIHHFIKILLLWVASKICFQGPCQGFWVSWPLIIKTNEFNNYTNYIY